MHKRNHGMCNSTAGSQRHCDLILPRPMNPVRFLSLSPKRSRNIPSANAEIKDTIKPPKQPLYSHIHELEEILDRVFEDETYNQLITIPEDTSLRCKPRTFRYGNQPDENNTCDGAAPRTTGSWTLQQGIDHRGRTYYFVTPSHHNLRQSSALSSQQSNR